MFSADGNKHAHMKGAISAAIVCCAASIVAHFARKVSYSASPQTFTAFAVHTIVALHRLVLIAPSALALEIHFQRFQ